MRTRRLGVYPFLLAALICVFAALLIVGNSARRTGVGNAADGQVPIPTWTPGEPDYDMIYDKPTKPPLITKAEAIAAADEADYSAPGAPYVSARYELLTEVPANAYEWQLEQAGLDKLHPDGFVKIPVWVVSCEGLHMPSMGDNPPTYNSELNVVVSAENGKVLFSYTFR